MPNNPFSHKALFVEKEGRDRGELLTLSVDGREYVGFNIYNASVGSDYIDLIAQDLSKLSLGADQNYQIYLHNGNGTITAEGSSTNKEGYYIWYNPDNEFKILVQFTSGTATTSTLITDYTLKDNTLTETTLG